MLVCYKVVLRYYEGLLRYWGETQRIPGRSKVSTGWFTLKKTTIFPGECPRVFSIQTVKVCTRLLCALAKTSPDVFWFVSFSPDFSSVKIFRKMWTTLTQFFRRKKRRKKPAGQASERACRTRVQNFRVYLSQKPEWTFRLLCVKMSQTRYFLQITWF